MGRTLDTDIGLAEAFIRAPGDAVEITVEGAGEPTPLILHGIFRAATPARAPEGFARSSALQVMALFPIPFLLVAFAVLFLRLEEPNAWLLALLFCAFIAAPSLLNPSVIAPALLPFAFGFRAAALGMLCALFYLFFAVFPIQPPLDRRFPWLKWAGLLLGVCIVVPGLRTGEPSLPRALAHLVGSRNSEIIHFSLTYVNLPWA